MNIFKFLYLQLYIIFSYILKLITICYQKWLYTKYNNITNLYKHRFIMLIFFSSQTRCWILTDCISFHGHKDSNIITIVVTWKLHFVQKYIFPIMCNPKYRVNDIELMITLGDFRFQMCSLWFLSFGDIF